LGAALDDSSEVLGMTSKGLRVWRVALAALIVGCGTAVPLASGVAGATGASTFRAVSGGGFNSIACASNSHCVAVGLGLTTSRVSSDGGNNWAKATTPIPGVAKAVTCPTSTLCIAVGAPFLGNTGAAWRSTDAGVHWSAATVAAGPSLSQVTCSSATRCLANGALSTNGGTSWARHTFPVSGMACDRSGSGHCVGVTSSGHVEYTTNGGTSWAASTVPAGNFGTAGATCPSATACYVPAFVGSSIGILRSTNGGKTFASFTDFGFLSDGGGEITNIACEDATHCIVVGDFPNSGSVESEELFADSTADGWHTDAGSGTPPTEGWVACTTTRCMNASTAIATIDSLAGNWTTRLALVTDGVSTGVACHDDTHCIQVGPLGAMTSSDGGQTWRNSYVDTDLVDPILGAPACPTSLECFIAEEQNESQPGTFGVLQTTNGGMSWGFSTEGPEYIACPSSTHCIGIGPTFSGPLAQFDWNSGHWTNSSVIPPALGPITCAAATECFLTSPHHFSVTHDQGASWHALPLQNITHLSCVDAMHCLATIGTAIKRTSNGGTSWTTSLANASALTCNASNRCLGETATGIVESTNGGTTWVHDAVNGAPPGGTDARCRGTFCVVVGAVTLRTP
jgi:hypothetical protein